MVSWNKLPFYLLKCVFWHTLSLYDTVLQNAIVQFLEKNEVFGRQLLNFNKRAVFEAVTFTFKKRNAILYNRFLIIESLPYSILKESVL